MLKPPLMHGASPWTAMLLLLSALWSVPGVTRADTALLMFDQDDCPYCARWRAEVGVVYPKTAEGQRAPLRVIDLQAPLPADLSGLKRASFSPVFVLWHNGEEVGRIRGYNGDAFFWGLLETLFAELDSLNTD